jgi:hypothetical protein
VGSCSAYRLVGLEDDMEEATEYNSPNSSNADRKRMRQDIAFWTGPK